MNVGRTAFLCFLLLLLLPLLIQWWKQSSTFETLGQRGEVW
jgi:hypothetical protein